MLKSSFISLFMLVLHIACGIAIFALIDEGINLTNIGLLLSALPGALFFDYLLAFKAKARSGRHLPGISLIKLGGLILIIIDAYQSSHINSDFLGLALANLIGWGLYDYWYSSLNRSGNVQIKVGSPLPAVTFETPDKKAFSLEDLIGSPALLLFYRGNWCPLCMAQIKEVAAQYQQLVQMGVKVLLISPQPHDHSIKLARQFEVPFIFLQDKDNAAARRLGIVAKNGLPLGLQVFGYDSDTVMPTVVITDKKGKVVFADLTDNYRVRPEPEAFIRLLRNLQASG